jgi:DNA-binding MarR family transcriptional regulator
MSLELSRALHTLTARLDRAADRMLRAEQDVSYRRFLVLFMIGELDTPNQRTVAVRLGITEPSVSRMIGALVSAGLLDAAADAAGGNQRRLRLTPDGRELVGRCCDLLVRRLAALVEASGVPYDVYTGYTVRLLAALDGHDQGATAVERSIEDRPDTTGSM